MVLNFTQYAKKGNAFIGRLAEKLDYPEDHERAGRVLLAILHSLRNHLTVEESLQFLAQLPMFLKAAYVASWKLSKRKKRIKHVDEFISEIRQAGGKAAKRDFKTDKEVVEAVKIVSNALREYVSKGEMDDVKSQLPKDLKDLVRERFFVEKLNKATMI